MHYPKITVVTPSFNQGRFLGETLDSVFDQMYPNLEYIVMDGGSKDRSVEILREVGDRLAHWQSALDDGQGAAIIDGWNRGSGDLVTWLNSDDVLLPGSLEAAARVFENGADIVVGDPLSIDETGIITGFRPLWRGPRWMHRSGLLTVGQPGTFYRRSLAESVGFFNRDLIYSMEHDLILRLLGAGATMQSANRPLAALRVYAETKTRMNRGAIADELRCVYSDHVRGLFSNHRIRRAAISAERYPYALRYLLPGNISKTRHKLRWLRHATHTGEVDWSCFD